MRILIVGDNPTRGGGVLNYTKPLASHLAKGNIVAYFFSSSTSPEYYSLKKPYLRKGIYKNYKTYNIINQKAQTKNYNNLSFDYSNWIELFVIDVINDFNPDIVHINEIFGLSSILISIFKRNNIKVIVTIHEYWWLCPHRVMVDFNKRICEGPDNMQKCAFCVSRVQQKKSDTYIKIISKLKHDFPAFVNLGLNIKKRFINKKRTDIFENISFGKLDYKNYHNVNLEKKLKERLDANIKALNMCDKVIAVSTDVKNTLIRYGVQENNIIVQHIGSTVAEKTIQHTKRLDENEIVFGFIGGVGYYKGVHQLVEAFTRLPNNLKSKAKLKIFGKYGMGYYNTINRDLIKDDEDKERIIFYGKFTPDDIPNITNQIDISVLPSLCADTAPQTIFESFSSGLPIIAPNVGGFPDFIKDDKNGLLYTPASVDSLLEKLQFVINNPSRIAYYQTNIPKTKTISENVQELIQLYREV